VINFNRLEGRSSPVTMRKNITFPVYNICEYLSFRNIDIYASYYNISKNYIGRFRSKV